MKKRPTYHSSTKRPPRVENATRNEHSPEERLNKVLAESGVAARRKADALIEEGRVRVNGKVVTELGTKVLPGDDISVDGDVIRRIRRYKYVLLNKPKDVITTMNDEHGRKTVIDLVPSRDRLVPVGRLDRNTTGVLLLTNDGELAHRMTHPRYGIERVYRVWLDRPISLTEAKLLALGVDIGDGERSSPCFVSVDDKDRTALELTLTEGKNREVRRMFESLGYDVKRLHRYSYGGITTSGLRRGDWRALTVHEIRELKRAVKLDREERHS